jgi:SAM-dependent methyltransferase
LNVLKSQIPKDKRSLLTLKKGHYADDLFFPNNYFEGVNFSMVLHFLSPLRIEKALKNIFLSLKPGGKLFLTTSSPYQRALSAFTPLYEKKKDIEEWPGYIEDIAVYVPHRAHLLPKENVVFCPTELTRLISKFGFRVLQATFFSRENMPLDLTLDGREYSGVICEKPKSSSSCFLEKYKEPSPTVAANER